MRIARRPRSYRPVPAGTRGPGSQTTLSVSSPQRQCETEYRVDKNPATMQETHVAPFRGMQKSLWLQIPESASSQVEQDVRKKAPSLELEPLATFICIPPRAVMDRLSCFWQKERGFPQEQAPKYTTAISQQVRNELGWGLGGRRRRLPVSLLSKSGGHLTTLRLSPFFL